jgi:glycosyltransferase involved in cell wall biosynthesis
MREERPEQRPGTRPWRVLVQIPCFNEEGQLADTVAAIRRALGPALGWEGDPRRRVAWEILIIDDGSSDGTLAVATSLGLQHVIAHGVNRGLAAAFQSGLAEGLRLGADVIVNTDADNQYDARDLPRLVQPILEHRADIVIGARPIGSHEEFSRTKKVFQGLGSAVVRAASRTDVLDAPSGFRALSRHAAARINIYDAYTYTLESIIQAGLNGLRVVSVPIRVNPSTRPSRLVRNNIDYIRRSLRTIVRTLLVYRAETLTLLPSLSLITLSLVLAVRWLVLWWHNSPQSHVPSLVLAATLFLTGLQLLSLSYLSVLSGINRRLGEQVLALQRDRGEGVP